MNSHTPRQPTDRMFEYLNTLHVDIEKGLVYNQGGKSLGGINPSHGYTMIGRKLDGKYEFFKRYHIVWWKATGKWPILEIDHKNRLKTDDRFDNLREVTHQQNAANNGKTNGLPTGVAFFKRNQKYQAYTYKNNKKLHLGYFSSPEEASNARAKAL